MFRLVKNLVLTKAGEETRAGIQQRLFDELPQAAGLSAASLDELGQLVRDRLAPTG